MQKSRIGKRNNPLIITKDASAAYGEDIFCNVNMCVETGECHGFIRKDSEGKFSLLTGS